MRMSFFLVCVLHKNTSKLNFYFKILVYVKFLLYLCTAKSLTRTTNMNLIWINSAKYLGDYRLSLSFSNGEQRVFDAKEFIATHPLFASLKDKQLFSQFQLDGWTVSWQDGRLDIAPEYLYEIGTPA